MRKTSAQPTTRSGRHKTSVKSICLYVKNSGKTASDLECKLQHTHCSSHFKLVKTEQLGVLIAAWQRTSYMQMPLFSPLTSSFFCSVRFVKNFTVGISRQLGSNIEYTPKFEDFVWIKPKGSSGFFEQIAHSINLHFEWLNF